MKKVVLFFAVSAAIALASCGGNNANQSNDADSTAVDSVVATVDSVVVADTVAAVDSAAAAVDSAAIVK